MKNLGIVLGVVLIVVLVVALLGGAGMMGLGGYGMRPWMMGPGMMGGYGTEGFGFPLLGGLLMFLFWALVIGGIVWLVVWFARGGAPGAPTAAGRETPLEILKARYARGEITKEQFDAMKKDLEG